MQEPWDKESFNRYRLVIFEGVNDVMRLDELQVAAIGLGSNKFATEQLEQLNRFARQLANNRIDFMPDYDEEGESGFKDLLWKLTEAGFHVRLGWSSRTHLNRQPESLSEVEWLGLDA